MNANRHGTYANFASDLLGYPALGQQPHDLPLARCKRCKPSLQIGQCQGFRATQSIVLDAIANRIKEFLVPKGLGQELYRAGFHSADRHRNVRVRGNKYK